MASELDAVRAQCKALEDKLRDLKVEEMKDELLKLQRKERVMMAEASRAAVEEARLARIERAKNITMEEVEAHTRFTTFRVVRDIEGELSFTNASTHDGKPTFMFAEFKNGSPVGYSFSATCDLDAMKAESVRSILNQLHANPQCFESVFKW